MVDGLIVFLMAFFTPMPNGNRRPGRLRGEWRVDGGVRCVEGSVNGLRNAWVNGPWLAEAGRLSAPPFTIAVTAAGESRAPHARWEWLRESERVVVPLTAVDGAVERVVAREDGSWVRERLLPTSSAL